MAETIISPGVFTRENDISFVTPAPTEVGACIIGPAVKGPVEIPTVVTSYNEYVRVFGDTFESASSKQEFLTSIAAKNYFSQGGNNLLVARVVTGTFTGASNTHISASAYGSSQPFELETLGKGVIYNNATGSIQAQGEHNTDSSIVSGSSDNLRWEISNVNNSKGTFTVSVRRGDDSLKNKIVLETFNNVDLDPNSPNYIEKVIGNQRVAISGDNDNIVTSGEYVNRSKYIRVSSASLNTINYIGNNGQIRVNAASSSLPIAQSGSFFGAQGNIVKAAMNFNDNIAADTQGLGVSDYSNVITLLNNSDDFKFNVISAPGIVDNHHGATVDGLIDLAESRGDCIAVVDLYAHGASVANVTGQADTLNSSYAAAYWPWLQTDSATGKNVWAPASAFIPGVYAFTDGANAPWFAPAGLVRGGLAGVIQAERRLSRTQRDSLYDAKVNPIASFPGTGIAVFGQKTLQTKSSALDRVNVRRLLIDLKEFIGNQAQNLVFEQNTVNTRNKFLAAVNPYLDSVVQRQGLYAYRVAMDDSNNTADVVDRNQLIGQVFIQPAKTAEFIVLDFTVEPTGASFGA
jgi:uncharacterized protein